jgi:hypothetical protein
MHHLVKLLLSIALAASVARTTLALNPPLLPGAWTWIMGSNITTECSRGFFRQPDPANAPCARRNFGTWVDDHNGCMYIFGGSGEAGCASPFAARPKTGALNFFASSHCRN